jgi:chromosome segregation ATPase
MKAHERLAALSNEIAEAQTNLRIVDEQLAYIEQVSEDARIRALVSETPLADREYREAREDLERMRRSQSDAGARLQELRAEQDRLLERLLDEPAGER